MMLAGCALFLVACTQPIGAAAQTAAAATAAFAEPTVTPTAQLGVIFVDAEQKLNEISPYVFGSNYGPWEVVPVDLMPQAQSMGLRFLRFPGGNFGDQNDVTHLQIDTFINLARQLGAEPSISVRFNGGTPEAAAELVRYTNIGKGYGVRYWSIGNEPQYYDGYDTARFNLEWRQIAEAMKAVDPSILLLGPEVTQFLGDPAKDPKDSSQFYWIDEFLKANGDFVDIVSIHRYPFPISLSSGPADKQSLAENTAEWDSIIPNLRDLIHDLTDREIPVAVTEFNSHWDSAFGGDATPDSVFSALWLADVLGHLMTQRVDIAAQFAIQSSSDNGGWGIFSKVDPRPSYYVYTMYQHFGNQLVYSASGVEDVSVYAATNDSANLTIVLINLGQVQEVPLSWTGNYAGSGHEWLFDAEHNAQDMGALRLQNGETVTLPAESMLLIELGK